MLDTTKTCASARQLQKTNALIQAARRARPARRARSPLHFCLRSMAEIEERSWNEPQKQIRAIGEQLFTEGGKALMLQTWERIFLEDMWAAKQVEIAWEGIGGWYR